MPVGAAPPPAPSPFDAPKQSFPERIEPADGDPARVGTIHGEMPLRTGGLLPDLTPAPPDHPGWAEQILVPPTADDLGLIVARDLDAALRDGQ